MIPKLSIPTITLTKWHLHAIHAFFLILTLMFLILPAVTGPSTDLWWLTISYNVPGASGDGAGGRWHLGGLGVCKLDEECVGSVNTENAPSISGSIKSALMFHFAVAALLFIIAVVELLLIHRSGMSIWRAWTTSFLPLLGGLLVISTMSVDLIIRSRLLADKGIEDVRTEAVFWLSVVAAFISLLWAATVYRIRQIRHDGTADELREPKERRPAPRRKATEYQGQAVQQKTVLENLWPWS